MDFLLQETGYRILDQKSDNIGLLVALGIQAFVKTEAGDFLLQESGSKIGAEYLPFVLSASANIAAGGATATTAILTSPGAKTGSDFQAGYISDDTNPLPSLSLTADKYTELEFSIKATEYAEDNTSYQFQVTYAGKQMEIVTQLPEFLVLPESTAYSQTLRETLVNTDTGLKLPGRILLDTITHTDTFVSLRTAMKTLSDTITHTDTLVAAKAISQILTDTISHVATLLKQPARNLTETTSLTDTILKLPGRILSEATSLLDTILKLPGRIFSDSVTHTDSTQKLPGKVLSDSVTNTDSKLSSLGRLLSDTFSLSDSMLKVTGRVLSDVLSHIDTMSRSTGRVLSDTTTATDSIRKQNSRLLLEQIAAADTFSKQLTLVRSFLETVHLSDVIIHTLLKVFTEMASFVDRLRLNLNGQKWFSRLRRTFQTARNNNWFTRDPKDWQNPD